MVPRGWQNGGELQGMNIRWGEFSSFSCVNIPDTVIQEYVNVSAYSINALFLTDEKR